MKHICGRNQLNILRIIADRARQAKQWTKTTTISDEAQEASYAFAEILKKV
jgi:hypothetical protein